MGYWNSRYSVHHIDGDFWNETTTCGRDVGYYRQGIYDSWRGVTCKQCKAQKERAATKVRDAKRAKATSVGKTSKQP